MSRRCRFAALLIAFTFIVLGCVSAEKPSTAVTPIIVINATKAPTPTLQLVDVVPTVQPVALPPTVTAAPSPTTSPPTTNEWVALEAGLEQRTIELINSDGRVYDSILQLRIDPNLFAFDVAYTPTEPKSLEQWLTQTGALIVVNGGFFTAEYYATGLTIVDGAATGQSYDFGGMVEINGGVPTVRSLGQQPYDLAESAESGLQAFPMLVQPGGVIGFNEETGRRARRTVIAQDFDGNIILFIATNTNFTLYELSRYLVESDLNIDRALNLDGGPSTGLLHRDGAVGAPAFSLLPTVLTINRR